MHLPAALKTTDRTDYGLVGVANPAAERRDGKRRLLTLSALSKSPSAGESLVVIRDISVGGFLMEAQGNVLSVGDMVELVLPERGIVSATVVWQSGTYSGCQFEDPLTTAAVSAALLSADPLNGPEAVMAGPGPLAHEIVKLGPELNFSAAFALALVMWTIIGAISYFFLS